MKIIQATNSITDSGAGVAQVVSALTTDLCSAGHDCKSYSIGQHSPDTHSHHHRVFKQTPPRALGWSRDLEMALLRDAESADVIHQHGLWSMLSHSICQVRKHCQTPTVLSAHGMLEPQALHISPTKKWAFSLLVERANLNHAHCLHALTHAEASHYRQWGLTNPIAVIPNGIECPPPHADADTAVLDLPGLPPLDDRRVLLSLCRLHPKKGLETLLDCWKELSQSYPNWTLLLTGPDCNGYAHTLQHAIDQGHIQNACITPPVFGQNKSALLSRADAFVLPSLSEGFPVALLEAAAHACPIIQTSTCYFPELAAAGGAIEVLPSRKTLADGLNQMLRLSDTDRIGIGQAARAYVNEHHTRTHVTKQFVALYDFLGKGNPQPDFVLK